jgi:hypothetical protein
MRLLHLLPAKVIRWTSASVCFALILASLTLITPISSGSGFVPQGRNGQTNSGKAKKVNPVPPLPGAPAASLPGLEETRQRITRRAAGASAGPFNDALALQAA